MSLQLSLQMAELPECVITGSALGQIGFTTDTLFRIAQFANGLILSLIEPETEPDLAAPLHETEFDPHQWIDWVRDNGELYLAGRKRLAQPSCYCGNCLWHNCNKSRTTDFAGLSKSIKINRNGLH